MLHRPVEFTLSLTAYADELEREKARQRTYDAMLRKARAGHVTGGRCFGYDNVRANGHVERRINETEAAVVRGIFELCAAGYGMKATAKQLNAEGAPSPRAQQGRSQSWAPSSVRTVLFRDLYRGVITWNRTRKRDQWGQKHQTDRPEGEWIDVPAPHLRVVDEKLWEAARWSEAAEAARAAVRLDPANAIARANLGVALYKLGDVAAARQTLERSLTLNPTNDQLRSLLARMPGPP